MVLHFVATVLLTVPDFCCTVLLTVPVVVYGAGSKVLSFFEQCWLQCWI